MEDNFHVFVTCTVDKFTALSEYKIAFSVEEWCSSHARDN